MKKIVEDAADSLCDKFEIEKKHWKNKLVELTVRGAL